MLNFLPKANELIKKKMIEDIFESISRSGNLWVFFFSFCESCVRDGKMKVWMVFFVGEVCLMRKFLQNINDSRRAWAAARQLLWEVRLSGWLLKTGSFRVLIGTFRRQGNWWWSWVGGFRSRKLSDRCPASGRSSHHGTKIHSGKPVSLRFGDDQAWPCFVGTGIWIFSNRKTGTPC